jgi:hypothetical protein
MKRLYAQHSVWRNKYGCLSKNNMPELLVNQFRPTIIILEKMISVLPVVITNSSQSTPQQSNVVLCIANTSSSLHSILFLLGSIYTLVL